MNRFLEVAVEEVTKIEELPVLGYEDGMNEVKIENDFSTAKREYISFEEVINKTHEDELSLEGYAFALGTDFAIVKDLVSLEKESKLEAMKKAVVNLIEKFIYWLNSVWKSAYKHVFNRLEIHKEYLKKNHNCKVSDADIKKAYPDNKEKVNVIISIRQKMSYAIAEVLNQIETDNENGWYVWQNTSEAFVLCNANKETKEISKHLSGDGAPFNPKVLDSILFDTKEINNIIKRAKSEAEDLKKEVSRIDNNVKLQELKNKISLLELKSRQPRLLAGVISSMAKLVKECVEVNNLLSKKQIAA